MILSPARGLECLLSDSQAASVQACRINDAESRVIIKQASATPPNNSRRVVAVAIVAAGCGLRASASIYREALP